MNRLFKATSIANPTISHETTCPFAPTIIDQNGGSANTVNQNITVIAASIRLNEVEGENCNASRASAMPPIATVIPVRGGNFERSRVNQKGAEKTPTNSSANSSNRWAGAI